MKAKYRIKWCKLLRSGKYKQTQNRLRRDNQKGSQFCCLGVLEKILPMRSSYRDELDRNCCDEAGLTLHEASVLMIMNDSKGKSFNEIADWIEENL